jgi:endoglucanase
LKADFAKVADWAKANQRPILLGEFGAYDKGPMPSRERYTAAVRRAAEEHGWSWSYWQFDSNFILYDIQKAQWVEPILRALIPRP